MDFERLQPEEVKERMDSGWTPYVIDVRRPAEADIARLSFADILHPHDRILEIVDDLPKDRDILVHCKHGGRSAMACAALSRSGVSRLINLEGGIIGWAERIDSSLQRY